MSSSVEEALDLSKPDISRRQSLDAGRTPPHTPPTPTSPIPSVSSDLDPMRGLHSVIDRSSSLSSDGHESDGSLTTSVHRVSGPLTSGHLSPRDDSSGSEGTDSNRPFKMYPIDSSAGLNPLAGMSSVLPGLSYGMPPSAIYGSGDSPMLSTPLMSYLAQRKRKNDNRDHLVIDNKKTKTIPEDKKDNAYWERRRKNNEAAKRSRDTRRQKEEQIAMRAAFLEQENLKLRAQVAILKNETAKLHYMLYQRS
ncbi:unnamed protein product [Owenia fusiformis]|uniref:Uncharacterized protein n=1 Tax=Owenia fusiformis TaxID=6347 RepID=A0A8J1Y6B1_OWEFU|nr:unnamed protein product [Owenia fusiformis]